MKECFKRRYKELGVSNHAYWRHRGAHKDFLWCECSNCGFRVEAYKAVSTGRSSTDYVGVKYKYCPMCGKEMRV
mgnify:CR=1 FL=1